MKITPEAARIASQQRDALTPEAVKRYEEILTAEDNHAISVDAAVGMLVTEDEVKATRALNFLQGRLGAKALGWFYKEGYYNVLVLGKPEDYVGGEGYFHHLKEVLDTWIGTDVMLTTLPISAYQEVSL